MGTTVTSGGPRGSPHALPADPPWWQTAVIYEVYPRSFLDTNRDGVGDLAGITQRLDYLAWLGVDALWIAPFYPSPMADFGYDVADYQGVDPLFGTMHDFDRLIDEAHERALRVIVDFVPNHTSIEHPWFIDARSSRSSPRRDWYLWRDPAADGGPPNNWQSEFGGSAWEWDSHTGQYYYHAFLPEQPDLNWRNPHVRRAMADVLRFWMNRGVDGFRVDVIWHLIKDAELRDNPVDGSAARPGIGGARLTPLYSADRPEVHDVIAEMRSVVDEYPGKVLIGETYLGPERLVRYYGEQGEGVHLPYNFELLLAPWQPAALAASIEEFERLLPPSAWPSWALGNHDQSRLATRVGDLQARVAAMLLLTLRGTPTLYYGDEIGMRDVPIPLDRARDPVARRLRGRGRDPQRTPMRWRRGRGAGFTRGAPWLPIGPDGDAINVEVERQDPRSTLSLYRSLIGLRANDASLRFGSYATAVAEGDLLAYWRELPGSRCLVALNFGSSEMPVRGVARSGWIELSTLLDRSGSFTGDLVLRPNEGVVVWLA